MIQAANHRGQWNGGLLYVPGDLVVYLNVSYICQTQNTGVNPATDSGVNWINPSSLSTLAHATNVNATNGTAGSMWCKVVVPELSAYLTGNPGPITIPVRRLLWSASGRIETNATAFTAGSIQIVELGFDGNWHAIASGPAALAASLVKGFTLGQGNGSSTIFTSLVTGLPCLGIAFQIVAAIAGGTITYMDIKGLLEWVDPEFELIEQRLILSV